MTMITVNLNQSIANLRMPVRMQRLPLSPKGYPTPWFVAFINGVPDFRVIGPGKTEIAVMKNKCWLCGDVLGSYKCFVAGPMCTINRVSAEPPSHLECAQYAAVACPFLSKPKMRRNDKDLPEEGEAPAGVMIERNPGVTALWVTKSFKPFKAPVIERGGESTGLLFRMDDPTNVMWYAEGRPATRAEVDESIRSGLPVLEDMAKKQGHRAIVELKRQIEANKKYLP
jgi:hypothetical protein